MKKSANTFTRILLSATLILGLMVFPGGVSFADDGSAVSRNTAQEPKSADIPPAEASTAGSADEDPQVSRPEPANTTPGGGADAPVPSAPAQESEESVTPVKPNPEIELTYFEERTLAQLEIAHASQVTSIAVTAVAKRGYDPIVSDTNLIDKRLVDIDKSFGREDKVCSFIEVKGSAGNFKLKALKATADLLPQDMLLTLSFTYTDGTTKDYDMYISKACLRLNAPANGGIPYGTNIQNYLDNIDAANEFIEVLSRKGEVLDINASDVLELKDPTNVIAYDPAKFSPYPALGQNLKLKWGTNESLDNPSIELADPSSVFSCYVASDIKTGDVVYTTNNALVSLSPNNTYWTNTSDVVIAGINPSGQACTFGTGLDATGELNGVLSASLLTMPHTQVGGLFVKDPTTGYVSILESVSFESDVPQANSLTVSKPTYTAEGYSWYISNTQTGQTNVPTLGFGLSDNAGAGIKSYALKHLGTTIATGQSLDPSTNAISETLTSGNATYDVSTLELVLTDWANNTSSVVLSDITKAYTTLFVVTDPSIQITAHRHGSGVEVAAGSTVRGSATLTLSMSRAIYTYLSITQELDSVVAVTEDRIYGGQVTNSNKTDIALNNFTLSEDSNYTYCQDIDGYENAQTQVSVAVALQDPTLSLQSTSSSFTINKEPSDIYISDGVGGLSGTYRHPVSASVYVEQPNFDMNSSLLLSDKRNDDNLVAPGEFSGWQQVEGSPDTYAGQVTFSENATYDLNVSVADSAGTRSELYPVEAFEIDDTSASVQVEYRENGSDAKQTIQDPGDFDKKPGIVTVTFRDINSKADAQGTVLRAIYNNGESSTITWGRDDYDPVTRQYIFERQLTDGVNYYELQVASVDGSLPKVYTFRVDGKAVDDGLIRFDVDESTGLGTVTVKDSSYSPDMPAPEFYYFKTGVPIEDLEPCATIPLEGTWREVRDTDTNAFLNYSFDVQFEKNKQYDLVLVVQDKAGNISGGNNGKHLEKFVIDGTNPIVDITCGSKVAYNDIFYCNDNPLVTVEVSDWHLSDPPAEVKVYGRVDEASAKEPVATEPLIWSNLNLFSEIPKRTLSFSFDADTVYDNYEVEVIATDTENRTTISTQKFIIDTGYPDVTLSITDKDGEPLAGNYFETEVYAKITVVEKNLGAGNTFETSRPKLMSDSFEVVYPPENFTGWDQAVSADTHTTKIKLDLPGKYNLSAVVADLAGNTDASDTIAVTIDNTRPELEIIFDDSGSTQPASRYYNANSSDVTATIKVIDDFGFDKEKARVVFEDLSGDKDSPSPKVEQGWSEEELGDGRILYTTGVTFSQEGTYQLAARVADMLDRDSDPYYINVFTIDRTNPILFIEFDNNESSSVNYYNAPRTATIHVMDENFADGVAGVSVGATDDSGAPAPAPGISGWGVGESESERVATIYFGGEYHYTLSAIASDAAGNGATPFEEPEFIIDMTMPEIIIEGLQNTGAYAGELAPKITFREAHFDDYDARVSFQKATGESAYMFDDTSVYNTTEKTIDIANIEAIPENDNVYYMRATITDKAGNSREEVNVFSINRFGSTYIVGAATQAFLGKYINIPKDVTIIEINPSGLIPSETRLRLSKDVDWTKSLTAGSEFIVGQGSNQDLWNMYTYTIPAATFTEDGHYNVVARSIDRAENLSENIMENKTTGRDASVNVNFTLDTTAPKGRFVNAKQDENLIATQYDLEMQVTDNLAWDHAVLYVNGKLANRFEAKEDELGSDFNYSLKESPDKYDLRLEVYDKAGNSTIAEATNISVTEVPLTQIANDPVSLNTIIALSILGVALLSTFMFFLIWRKRKKDKEQVVFENQKR